MSIQEALAAAPWSLMAPNVTTGTATGPRAGIGRAEEVQEERRFDAAMRRLEETTANDPPPVDPVQPVRMGRPEEWQTASAAAEIPSGDEFFGEDGFTFSDLLDIVNPLQHIPGVSTVYRALTGDEMSAGARLAGGALYGGPVGAVGAIANNVSEDLTGDDLGGAVMAALTGDPASEPSPGAPVEAGTALAAATTSPTSIDDAATVAAAIAPAAAPSATPSATTPALANPFFASQPTGVPFATMPTGSSPILPPRDLAAAPPPPQIQSPVTAAATGVPQLSPESAEILMRMSQETSVTPTIASPAAAPPPPPPPPPAPAVDVSAAAEAVSTGPRATQTASFIDAVPNEDLPAAMMQALAKYQDMKAGQ